LKRRIASLPPISLAIFNTQLQPEPELFKEKNKPATAFAEQGTVSPHRCLFCHQKFGINDEGLKHNLEHMSTVHGLFIPDIAMVSHLESFLSYLCTIVREWHECLYCGVTRECTVAIQSHMRDRGHCKLNLDTEPELLGFWEDTSKVIHGRTANRPGTELVLSSNEPIPSKLPYRRRAKASRANGERLVSHSVPTSRNPRLSSTNHECLQLARRDELGLQSLPAQQRQALILAVKRSQKEEAVASRASEWSYAKKANKQKHDQSHGPLAWAKGGMHNLLPR
jgi:pre-60S factor REI1